MRKAFDEELDKLKSELVEMGNAVEAQVQLAIDALIQSNVDLANRVIEGDREVNRMERAIEERCLNLILKQQPVASDLRLISSALKMVTDMERIGDNARDISYFTSKKGEALNLKILPKMATIATQMVHDAVDSFVMEDLSLVKKVTETDDILDKYYRDSKAMIMDYIRNGDIAEGDTFIELLMVSKYLERIGDHAENIVEWVYFSIEGTHLKEPER